MHSEDFIVANQDSINESQPLIHNVEFRVKGTWMHIQGLCASLNLLIGHCLPTVFHQLVVLERQMVNDDHYGGKTLNHDIILDHESVHWRQHCCV